MAAQRDDVDGRLERVEGLVNRALATGEATSGRVDLLFDWRGTVESRVRHLEGREDRIVDMLTSYHAENRDLLKTLADQRENDRRDAQRQREKDRDDAAEQREKDRAAFDAALKEVLHDVIQLGRRESYRAGTWRALISGSKFAAALAGMVVSSVGIAAAAVWLFSFFEVFAKKILWLIRGY